MEMKSSLNKQGIRQQLSGGDGGGEFDNIDDFEYVKLFGGVRAEHSIIEEEGDTKSIPWMLLYWISNFDGVDCHGCMIVMVCLPSGVDNTSSLCWEWREDIGCGD